MKLAFSSHFIRGYRKAPLPIQRAFDKQSALLLQNLHHPSLRAKKYGGAGDLWQARVTDAWRFYFTIEGDCCRLHEIRKHPKT
jgi:mRNA-degrading endonuclease RelE of RelBE toxin-antitoxin system